MVVNGILIVSTVINKILDSLLNFNKNNNNNNGLLTACPPSGSSSVKNYNIKYEIYNILQK